MTPPVANLAGGVCAYVSAGSVPGALDRSRLARSELQAWVQVEDRQQLLYRPFESAGLLGVVVDHVVAGAEAGLLGCVPVHTGYTRARLASVGDGRQ